MNRRRSWPVILSCTSLALTASCSSGQDRARGTFAVKLSANPPAPEIRRGADEEPPPGILSATLTVSGIEARRADGTWMAVERGLPMDVDIVALSQTGHSVTLPADLLPEGACTALQLRLTNVGIDLAGRGRSAIATPANGWTLIVPADFAISPGRSTTVELRIAPEVSLKRVGDSFAFEPQLEVAGVQREGG